MKKFTIINLIISILTIGITVFANTEEIKAFIADYTLTWQGPNYEKRLEYPLISYDDHAYISIRDVAKMLRKNVEWEDGHIMLNSYKQDNAIITEKETALKIGKAIIEERYKDRVNENSMYMVLHFVGSVEEVDEYFEVNVLFDPPVDRTLDLEKEDDYYYFCSHADAKIRIDENDGSISISEYKDGKYEWVYDYRK
jgi:hypothetical protein